MFPTAQHQSNMGIFSMLHNSYVEDVFCKTRCPPGPSQGLTNKTSIQASPVPAGLHGSQADSVYLGGLIDGGK